MRIAVTLLIALLLCWLPAYAAANPELDRIYQLDATGSIEIGPDGRVVHYQLDKGQPAPIEQALARNIAQWRFEPILVDGKPVIAKTGLRISLEALPTAEEDYELRIGGVWFGAPGRNAHNMRPPRYPEAAISSGVGGQVVLVLELDKAGNVLRTHVEQVSLDQAYRTEALADRFRRLFADVSVKTAMRWTFDMNETLGGEPVGASIRVPVSFSLSDGPLRGGNSNVWQRYIPGPRTPAPWLVGDKAIDRALAQRDTRELRDDDVQSLDSRFRPLQQLVGSKL